MMFQFLQYQHTLLEKSTEYQISEGHIGKFDPRMDL